MHLAQWKLCTRKTELALEVKSYALAKRGHNVAVTLCPTMLAVRGKTRAPRRHKECFWRFSETFLVSRKQNLCPPQMLRAWQNESTLILRYITSAMLPPKCVLVLPPPYEFTWPWRLTLTNGRDVKCVFPLINGSDVKCLFPLTNGNDVKCVFSRRKALPERQPGVDSPVCSTFSPSVRRSNGAVGGRISGSHWELRPLPGSLGGHALLHVLLQLCHPSHAADIRGGRAGLALRRKFHRLYPGRGV